MPIKDGLLRVKSIVPLVSKCRKFKETQVAIIDTGYLMFPLYAVVG